VVTTPRQLKNAPFVTTRGTVPRDQTIRIGPIPLTDATRTLLDIAGNATEEALEIALDDALRRSITSLPRLRWLLRTAGGKGKKGSQKLRALVERRSDGQPIPESVLETRLWKPLSRLGVPRPIRQYEIEWEGRRYRIDFAFPHAMVAVEAQSYRWHSSAQSLQNDAHKHNALVLSGWNVIYLTWDDIKEKREGTVQLLRDLLVQRFL
jgi:very-short-patch-repair endonuclease